MLQWHGSNDDPLFLNDLLKPREHDDILRGNSQAFHYLSFGFHDLGACENALLDLADAVSHLQFSTITCNTSESTTVLTSKSTNTISMWSFSAAGSETSRISRLAELSKNNTMCGTDYETFSECYCLRKTIRRCVPPGKICRGIAKDDHICRREFCSKHSVMENAKFYVARITGVQKCVKIKLSMFQVILVLMLLYVLVIYAELAGSWI